jgi:hypothetical protein
MRYKRPLSVTILACVYIAVGAIGLIFHAREIQANHLWRFDGIAIEMTEALALVSGVFLLRGREWARWLALAWMAFHVVLSAFHAIPELVVHSGLCALIAWLLFRMPASQYFRDGRTQPT